MGAGPARGRRLRALIFRAAFACLVLVAASGEKAEAQAVTPDLFSPSRATQIAPGNLAPRPIGATLSVDPNATPDSSAAPRRRVAEQPASSPAGNAPANGLPAANGASDTGYDSLNRTRKQPKYYPAQAKPKKPPGPGTPPPKDPPRTSTGQLRLSIPPSSTANTQPVPPGMAGTVPGQPSRRRLKIDDDPFGAVGDYAGGFLIKSAVELSGGYDTNPARTFEPHGLPFWVVAPEFLAVSDWERHAVVADLRGSFTGYGGTLPATVDGLANPAPVNIDRPDFTGHVDGRLDVTRDFDLTAQTRLRVATDNPGSPNIQAGLARYPVFATFGGTLGFDQRFNRLQVSAGATADRTVYQNSTLTDGETASNDDRNFNQYGGISRVSYELKPGLKPFVEAEGDTRVHDQVLDRNGFARDSNGGYVKGGTSFEFTRLLTGELAVGWSERTYTDPRLRPPAGPLDDRLAGVERHAADDGEVLLRHADRRDHAAGRLRRAGAHLCGRGRSRFSPLADRHRQVHLRHLRLSRRHPQGQDLLGRGRSHLQDEPQPLDQGHHPPRHPRFQRAIVELAGDGGNAGGEVAELRGGSCEIRTLCLVIPGCAEGAGPESITPSPWLWIPGSPLCGAPE